MGSGNEWGQACIIALLVSNLVGMDDEKDKGLEKLSEQSREGYICQMCRPDLVSLLLHP